MAYPRSNFSSERTELGHIRIRCMRRGFPRGGHAFHRSVNQGTKLPLGFVCQGLCEAFLYVVDDGLALSERRFIIPLLAEVVSCLLYTSDAADE